MFGTTPDRLFLNYRLWLLMTLLHESSLASAMYSSDPRITYLQERLPIPFPMSGFGITQRELTGDTASTSVTDTNNVDVQGISRQTLRLEFVGSDAVWTWLQGGLPSVTVEPQGGSPVTLDVPSGGYRVLVPIVDGAAWIFDIAYRPQFTLVDLADTIESVSPAVTAEMFRGTSRATPQAPFDELWTLWNEPQRPFDRLSAATLTLAYATELAQ